MPTLGLEFSKMDIVPSTPSASIDSKAFEDLGCTVVRDGNFEVMKSPIGTPAWCQEFVMSRVRKLSRVCTLISQIPSSSAALYLLRYQAGRMTYTVRTTPSPVCGAALVSADRVIQTATESILDAKFDTSQRERAFMPIRLGGLGLQSINGIADAAFTASYTKALPRITALTAQASQTGFGDPHSIDLFDEAVRPPLTCWRMMTGRSVSSA
jgi:hypothetical protein